MQNYINETSFMGNEKKAEGLLKDTYTSQVVERVRDHYTWCDITSTGQQAVTKCLAV